MMKNDKQTERKDASYYKLHTGAVEDLVSANKENTPKYSEAELNKYRSGSKAKWRFPQWLKIILIKTWFYGAVCFFVFWGLGLYLADQLDLAFVAAIVMGMVTDLLINHFLRFTEKPGGSRKKAFFRKAGVAVIKVMNKNVFDSRFKAALVMRVAFFGENCVRLGKIKADFRVAKEIGVVFNKIDGVCTPFFPGANSNGGRKAEILQSGHNFSCTESTKIFGIYFKGKFFRNAFDSCEFKRCVFNDFKSIFAESFDNSLRKGGADPLKRTAGKIFADSGCGSGKSSLANVRAELGSIGRMGRESAGEGNFLAGFNFAKLANNRNKLALHIKIKHNKTAFGFVSNNSVNGAAYFLRFLFFVFFGHASFSVLNNKYIIVFFYLFVNLP